MVALVQTAEAKQVFINKQKFDASKLVYTSSDRGIKEQIALHLLVLQEDRKSCSES